MIIIVSNCLLRVMYLIQTISMLVILWVQHVQSNVLFSTIISILLCQSSYLDIFLFRLMLILAIPSTLLHRDQCNILSVTFGRYHYILLPWQPHLVLVYSLYAACKMTTPFVTWNLRISLHEAIMRLIYYQLYC